MKVGGFDMDKLMNIQLDEIELEEEMASGCGALQACGGCVSVN